MTRIPLAERAKSEELLHCFADCLRETLLLLDDSPPNAERGERDAHAVHDALMATLDDASRQASGLFGTQVVLLARRFVTAWIDERLASDPWSGRGAWQARPLQSDWGEGRTAGEWFFEALTRLEPARDGDTALAALALRCLALGFDGRMHYSPPELLELRRDTAQRFSLTHAPSFFPPPVDAGNSAPVRRGAWRWWIAPVLTAGILVFAYLLADRVLFAHLASRSVSSSYDR